MGGFRGSVSVVDLAGMRLEGILAYEELGVFRFA